VWRAGRFRPAAAGTRLVLGARGAAFTDVVLPDGAGRIANTLLWRCR
jgi:hypothetical protein